MIFSINDKTKATKTITVLNIICRKKQQHPPTFNLKELTFFNIMCPCAYYFNITMLETTRRIPLSVCGFNLYILTILNSQHYIFVHH